MMMGKLGLLCMNRMGALEVNVVFGSCFKDVETGPV